MTKTTEHLMYTAGVGAATRFCHAKNRDGMPCRVLGPWEWNPVTDGVWYCRFHQSKGSPTPMSSQ